MQGIQIRAWRSIYLTPASTSASPSLAAQAGADAVALDLEDSVPAHLKIVARQRLAEHIDALKGVEMDVLVRINSSLRLIGADLEACVLPGVRAVVVPQCEGADWVRMVSRTLDELEAERGIRAGHIGLVPLVESCAAFFSMRDIAGAHPRVVAMGMGAEDFSRSAHMEACAQNLLFPKQQLILAARAAGILPIGLIGPIARQGASGDEVRSAAQLARQMGSAGAFTADLRHLGPLNEGFTG